MRLSLYTTYDLRPTTYDLLPTTYDPLSTNRSILRLALPSILANITIPLVGIVDTAIAGHIADVSAIGGIAVGSMLFDLLYWNFGFLRVGTAGLTAQAWGREQQAASQPPSESHTILSESVSIALWAAALILLLQWPFVNGVLWLMPCSEEVAQFARQYFYIRVWAAPATLTLMALKGWFIGMQNTVAPMITDIVVNAVNILASYLLAVNAGIGAMGVAWGTVIAQYTGLAVGMAILAFQYHLPHIILSLRQLLGTLSSQLTSFYSQLFLRSLCFMIVYVGYTIIASKYGDTELAMSSILMKLFMFFSYFIDGFAYAGEALTGRYIGEHDYTQLRRSIRYLFVWACSLGIVASVLYGIFSTPLISIMTNDSILLAIAPQYRLWLAMMPILSSLAFMWDGVFVGMAAGRDLLGSMICAAVAFLVGYFVLFSWLGITALYIAYMLHLIARSAYLTIKYKKMM